MKTFLFLTDFDQMTCGIGYEIHNQIQKSNKLLYTI